MGRASRRKRVRRWAGAELDRQRPRIRLAVENAIATSDDPEHLVARWLTGEWRDDSIINAAVCSAIVELAMRYGKEAPERPTLEEMAFQVRRWKEHQAMVMAREMSLEDVRRLVRPGPKILELLRLA